MEQEATYKQNGTCIWFKNAFGYIGFGLFTNQTYENQIYAHYKNINRKGLRDSKFRELKSGDIVEFNISEGFFCQGTQATNVRIIKRAESNGTSGQCQQSPGTN